MELDLPQRKKPDARNPDTRPELLRSWVDRLPLLNTEKTRQLLAAKLEALNALDIAPIARDELLEALSTSVMCTTDALKKEFLGRPLPLQANQALRAEQAIGLFNLMATGYRIMADDLGRNEAQNRELAVAIHRSLRYLSEIMLTHYQVYQQYQDGLWRSIHSLYALAEECKISRLSINDTTLHTPDTSNIETIYKQILLLSLACPYRLRQKEIHFAYNALMDWASFCRLQLPGTGLASGLFSVNIRADDPPAYRALHSEADSSPHYRILDTTAVTDRLRAVLENHSRNHTGIGNRDTLQQLILAWGAMPRRRFPRQSSTATLPVKLIVGLNNIHRLISEPQPGDAPDDEIFIDHALLQDPTFDRAGDSLPDRPVADDRTGTVTQQQGDEIVIGAYSAGKLDGAHVEFWKIADMSAGGYCLLWENSSPSVARVGELAAVVNQHDNPDVDWQLGVIRWMKFTSQHGLELGIQMLSPGALAVWAYVRNDDVGRHIAALNRMQGILLPGIEALDQADSLILPCLPFRAGSNSILEAPDGSRDVLLTRQLENTGRFAQYHFSFTDNGEIEEIDVQ